MAFKGYHLMFNGVVYPEKYCCNYDCTPDRRTDKNSGVKGKGVLNRTILPHKRSSATWNTGIITDEDIPYFMPIFENRDKISVTFWKTSILDYATGAFYIPDMSFKVLMVVNNLNYYRPIELEVIEY